MLPPSFRFIGLEMYTSASDQHHVAYFEWITPLGPSLTHHDLQVDSEYGWRGLTSNPEAHGDWLDLPQQMQEKLREKVENSNEHQRPSYSNKQYTTKLALIPGNTMTLGYDREHPLLPSDELIYDAEKECVIPTIDGSKRVVPYQVFLAQSCEHLDDWKKTPLNYAAMAEYVDKHLLPPRSVTLRPFLLEQSYMHIGEFLNLLGVYQYSLTRHGRHSFCLQSGGNFPVSHRLVMELLSKQGFRLPSSDEWEYACMAGRKKLFFWEESDKRSDYYPEFPQNTFGLHIARDCGDWELCMAPGLLRGGDGGNSQCGWGGYLMHYLTYVSAYYEKRDLAGICGACFRRTYSL